MVLDILAAIGLKETGQYVAKDVLLPLLQGSLKITPRTSLKAALPMPLG
jgi:hypothetical protein